MSEKYPASQYTHECGSIEHEEEGYIGEGTTTTFERIQELEHASSSELVRIYRHMDEADAWCALEKEQEKILTSIGKAKAFCTIQRVSGSYAMYHGQGVPLLTAFTYRDDSNWTIVQITIFSGNMLSLLLDKE
jgi:hypothetical protein